MSRCGLEGDPASGGITFNSGTAWFDKGFDKGTGKLYYVEQVVSGGCANGVGSGSGMVEALNMGP